MKPPSGSHKKGTATDSNAILEATHKTESIFNGIVFHKQKRNSDFEIMLKNIPKQMLEFQH